MILNIGRCIKNLNFTTKSMNVTDLDLDAKLYVDQINNGLEESMLYIREEDSTVTFMYAGDLASIVNSVIIALSNDKGGDLYDILTSAIDIYEENYVKD